MREWSSNFWPYVVACVAPKIYEVTVNSIVIIATSNTLKMGCTVFAAHSGLGMSQSAVYYIEIIKNFQGFATPSTAFGRARGCAPKISAPKHEAIIPSARLGLDTS